MSQPDNLHLLWCYWDFYAEELGNLLDLNIQLGFGLSG
ncbi:hypothetical protein J671_3840 [Acinetobacter sp. 1130196]|nr:hypothetical protein J671_3840 [Acinetobacter sp. 1130196]